MKKYILSAMMLLPLLAGCKKAQQEGVQIPSGSDRMTFSARFTVAKSHFGNDPDSPQLYWDSSDKVAVYMQNAFDALGGQNHYLSGGGVSETLTISEIAEDGISATLASTKSKDFWFPTPVSVFPSGTEEFQDLYTYFAYYPSSDTPKSIELLSVPDEDDKDAVNLFQYLPFNVPETQDGGSYSDYQILFDPGLPEDESVDLMPYLVSKTAVMGNEAQVTIGHLTPVTSMIRFTLQFPEGVGSRTFDGLTISILGDDDQHSIAGDARLLLYQYGDQDEVPICYQKSNLVEYLQPAEAGHDVITISSSVTITQEPSAYLYAVLIPFKTLSTTVKVKFTVQDEDGHYYVGRRALPVWGAGEHETYYGFREGYRYKTAVTLYPVEMDPDAGNAGQYADGGDPFETI